MTHPTKGRPRPASECAIFSTTDAALSNPSHLPYEIVERKGIGHPDTLADGIAELASIRYSQHCLQRFGVVLHHNLDKVAVMGGLALFDWRSGEYVRPLRIVFGGRASTSFGSEAIPLAEILEGAAREQLALALPGVNQLPVEFHHLTTDSSMYEHWFQPRSREDLPELSGARASDTAYLVAASPVTVTEHVALATETFLRQQAWAGSDIKVMAVRQQTAFRVACCVPALVGAFRNCDEYREALALTKKDLVGYLGELTDASVDLTLRALDDIEVGPASPQDCYVNLSGSAIDYGEDGLVGRGNSRNGLINPNHSAGNEALFGKNPVYHVGKVGAFLADEAANAVAAISGPCRVGLVYRRGDAYDAPMRLQLHVLPGSDLEACRAAAKGALARTDWTTALVEGEQYRPRLFQPPKLQLGL